MNADREKIDKLPKWAQEYIASLENTQKNAIDALKRFDDQQTESNIYVEDIVCDKVGGGITCHKHYIQSNSISIRVQNSFGLKSVIRFYVEKDEIKVMANNQLVVEPVASNVVILKTKD